MYTFYLKNLKGRDDLEDLVVDGMIILRRMLKPFGVRVWIGFY
jgi:hypothetical protein